MLKKLAESTDYLYLCGMKKMDNIAELSEQVTSLREQISSKDKQLSLKDEQLFNKDEQLFIKDEQLSAKDELLFIKDEQLSLKDKLLSIKDQKIKELHHKILLLQRREFGRRSEKQLPEYNESWPTLFSHLEGKDLLDEEKEVLGTIIEEVKEEATKRRATTNKEKKHISRRCKLPENLRREENIIEPKGLDLSKMIKIGEDVTETLMYTPAEFWVKRDIRPIYKDKEQSDDNKVQIYQHPPLQNFLQGCIAGNSLLSQIIIDKFQYHLPEYRQIERFKALKVNIIPSTLNRWVHKVADKLYLLYKLQMEEVLSGDYIQVDESTQKVLDRVGKSRTAYVWIVRNPINKTVFYYYYEGSRSQDVILKLLKDYIGALQTDGYKAYNIYEDKKGVLLLGCLAHVRRKFENALTTTPKA